MSEVVLVRHAATVRQEGRPAAQWPLAPGATGAVTALAERLRPRGVTMVVTSVEPKAIATGRSLAAGLGVTMATAPGLHEHERGSLPLLDERAWRATLRRFFGHPDTLVFGQETGAEALRRFGAALGAVLAGRDRERLAVVTHGTVMSLLVAAHNPVDAFDLWRELAMPEALVLSWPELELLERIV